MLSCSQSETGLSLQGLQFSPAGCQSQLLQEQGDGRGVEVSFLGPLTSTQKTPWPLWGVFCSACSIPTTTRIPELGWLGLEKFQGRRRQPAWQTNLVPRATTREAHRFHSNPQSPDLEGISQIRKGCRCFSDAFFLLPVGNSPSQDFPFPLCFLEVGRVEKGLESRQGRAGRQARGKYHWLRLAWTTYGCALNFQANWGPHCLSSPGQPGEYQEDISGKLAQVLKYLPICFILLDRAED